MNVGLIRFRCTDWIRLKCSSGRCSDSFGLKFEKTHGLKMIERLVWMKLGFIRFGCTDWKRLQDLSGWTSDSFGLNMRIKKVRNFALNERRIDSVWIHGLNKVERFGWVMFGFNRFEVSVKARIEKDWDSSGYSRIPSASTHGLEEIKNLSRRTSDSFGLNTLIKQVWNSSYGWASDSSGLQVQIQKVLKFCFGLTSDSLCLDTRIEKDWNRVSGWAADPFGINL